jgi:hypothetical protein
MLPRRCAVSAWASKTDHVRRKRTTRRLSADPTAAMIPSPGVTFHYGVDVERHVGGFAGR